LRRGSECTCKVHLEVVGPLQSGSRIPRFGGLCEIRDEPSEVPGRNAQGWRTLERPRRIGHVWLLCSGSRLRVRRSLMWTRPAFRREKPRLEARQPVRLTTNSGLSDCVFGDPRSPTAIATSVTRKLTGQSWSVSLQRSAPSLPNIASPDELVHCLRRSDGVP
jgi:hypothetical protein